LSRCKSKSKTTTYKKKKRILEKVLKKYWIQMKLNEQLLRMRQMFSSINENKFEKPEYIKFDYNDIDIEKSCHSVGIP
jgi:hypothetical protein